MRFFLLKQLITVIQMYLRTVRKESNNNKFYIIELQLL